MDTVRYLQLDVFAEQAGGGNPLAVVIGADDWTDAAMQRFARWTGLVETTYLLPPTQTGASYRVRIFTPQREIAFAGHPTIGSAHAALETGFVSAAGDRLVQECGAGVGSQPVAGCTPGAPAAGGGRGRGGRGGVADTGEGTREQ